MGRLERVRSDSQDFGISKVKSVMELNSTIENLRGELLVLLNSLKYDFSQRSRIIVPLQPGVYAIYHKTGSHLLYIGESKHLRRRIFGEHLTGDKIASAFRRNLSDWEKLDSEEDISAYISDKCEFQFKQCVEAAAKRLEHFAIAILQPLLNR